jgi:hypothetical protein
MSIEAMRLALVAFQYADSTDHELQRKAILALEKAIEQAKQPVAWRTFDGEGGYEYRTYDLNEGYAQEWAKRNPRHVDWVDALYTAPPQYKPLTDEEIAKIASTPCAVVGSYVHTFARAIEAAHGIKGEK